MRLWTDMNYNLLFGTSVICVRDCLQPLVYFTRLPQTRTIPVNQIIQKEVTAPLFVAHKCKP